MITSKTLAKLIAIALTFVVKPQFANAQDKPKSSPQGAAAGQAAEPDFPRLVAQIEATMKEFLFSVEVFKDSRTQQFLADLRRLARRADSTASFEKEVWRASNRLPFSHFGISMPQSSVTSGQRMNERTKPKPPPQSDIELEHKSDGVSILTIRSFNDPDPGKIHQAFQEIARARSRALVIDLRDNEGGNHVSLLVAAHLLKRPARVGVVFGRSIRKRVLAGNLDGLPERDAGSVRMEEFFQLLQQHDGVIGRVEPFELRFDGPVVVLTSNRTGSACEPLVELLQREKRATLIGERTAGGMLSANWFGIGQGWRLRIPVFDFVTAEGVRIEGQGIEPDVNVARGQALDKAMSHLAATLENSP